MDLSEKEIDRLLTEAEEKIRGILLDLFNRQGIKVSGIDVDTRSWGNYRVSLDIS